MFLKVNARRSSLKLGNFSKMVAHYCGPFEILESIGLVAYMFSLTTSLSIHNVFHVYLLKKYILDANHVIDWNVIQVEQEGDFRVQPTCILDRKFKTPWNQVVGLVKVQWTCYGHEDAMRAV
jgi:hypothetical protein